MHRTNSDKPVRVGVFSTVPPADRAVRNLLAAGFTKDELAVICSDKYKEQFFRDVPTPDKAGSHTGEAALLGGAVGAAVGGLVLAVTTVATGGAALLVAGPALIAGSAITGTFVGAMTTRGFEKEIADYYDQAVQLGKILVAVEVEGADSGRRLAQAERILAEAGAEPVPLSEG